MRYSCGLSWKMYKQNLTRGEFMDNEGYLNIEFDKLIMLTGLEYLLLKFFQKINDLTQYDNNDHPDIIWCQIRKECVKTYEELKKFEVIK